tara:strand:- start:1196 stop:1513 length:318 start_codon:yes stop_codon:yes gene_type:complete
MSLEQYKDATRKELWEILQIQVERIAELENQWISVEDKLPELDDASVIVNFDNGSIECVHVGFFDQVSCGFDHRGSQMYRPYYVGHDPKATHWMPLPEPPKEQGE